MSHANRVLDWHSNLQEEDLPPEWMWPLTDEINEWFGEIKDKRRSTSTDDREIVPLIKNEDPRILKLRSA